MDERQLGRSAMEVSALGLGCWAIGGPFWAPGGTVPLGWGTVDDRESIRAIQHAIDHGITFFDTADLYGAGHSERMLAQALGASRHQVVIATKGGRKFNERTKEGGMNSGRPDYLRRACEASLRRLGTDYIDLYLFHVGDHPIVFAQAVRDTFEALVQEGKIRAYGWNTDDPQRAAMFASGPSCTAIEHRLNVLHDHPALLALCETQELASVNYAPLAMGLLSGKYNADAQFPPNDVRRSWDLKHGAKADHLLAQVRDLRDVLTSNGRTVAQGALAWIWARSDRTIPIPGFKTVQQVEEHVDALRFGPLTADQMQQIDHIVQRDHIGRYANVEAQEDDQR